ILIQGMNRDIDASELLLGTVFVAASVFSIVGIVCAEAGWFYTAVIWPAGLTLTAVALVALRRVVRNWRIARSRVVDWLAVAGVVIACGWLFLPPAEAIVDGGDASVYLAIGGMIETRHTLRPVEPIVASMPADVRDDLFSRDLWRPPLLNYFPGGLQI